MSIGLNLVRLREIQIDLEERCREEQQQNLTKELINLVLDKDLKRSFQGEIARTSTEQSRRVQSYWVKKGIIKPQEREKDGGWFYFDRTESIWIDIVIQLREFGLEFNKILKMREYLFSDKVKDFRTIDFCLMHSIIKEPYIMIIYSSGKTGLMTAKQYAEVISQQALAPHIVFNFYFLAQSIFPENNFSIGQKDGDVTKLSPAEMKLLYYIRTGDYQEIKIRELNGEISLLEVSRKINPDNRIIDIIQKAIYQDIEIKVENNHTVYIKS